MHFSKGNMVGEAPTVQFILLSKQKRERVTGKEVKTCTGETKPVLCKYVGTRQVLDKGVET